MHFWPFKCFECLVQCFLDTIPTERSVKLAGIFISISKHMELFYVLLLDMFIKSFFFSLKKISKSRDKMNNDHLQL